MVTVEEAIAQIDSYINAIIQDMIKFRTKRLEASSKVLDKIKALMEAISYSYRIGELYDKAIKIETETLKQRDISAPRIKLSYTGPKTTLLYNNYYVEVPEVPVFVWETRKPEQLAYEANVEYLRQNIAVKLPVNVNVKEEPFIENGIVYELDNIKIQHRVYFRRFLTINGTQYLFNVWLGFGKVVGKQYVSPSTTFENIEVPCTFISFLTEYTGESSIIIFGNEYTSKSFETGVSGQTRDILLIFTEGETIAFQLN